MNIDLKGKTVLITGGTHGIGLACALKFAEYNCNISVCSRSSKNIDTTSKLLDSMNVNFFVEKADVLNNDNIKSFFNMTIEKFGSVDILINNVGGGGTWGNESILDTNLSVWDDVYNKNVGAAIKFINLSLPFMKKNNWGRVITISSIASKKVVGRPWYIIAKKAEITLTRALSVKKEFVRNGITFNTVSPGAIMIPDTGWDERQKEDPAKFKKLVDNKFPMGKLGTPEDVANSVIFLCSNGANYINGSDIAVDGGQSNEEYKD